jgi:hypothetical protein
MTDEQVARICHEANRAYCQTLGDGSQVPWDEAPDWQKQSCINGVAFHRKCPTAQPRDSHVSWMDEKRRDGWVYGPVKDAEKKQHPCMVPYHELPEAQQHKDALFKAVCMIFCHGIYPE